MIGGTFTVEEDVSLYNGKEFIRSGILRPVEGAVLGLRPGQETLNLRAEVRTADYGVIGSEVKGLKGGKQPEMQSEQ
ncbi:hypothetical protein FOZ60_016010 [Perkinsus olseni]|nr:hypothetical protein FOZ60_016010 [Perkinsus olseni]